MHVTAGGGDEGNSEHGAHAGQTADYGGVRVPAGALLPPDRKRGWRECLPPGHLLPHCRRRDCVIELAGEIDFNTVCRLREAFADCNAASGHRTVVDFRGVTFMDSSSVNVLVGMKRAAPVGGGWIRLAGVPADVHEVLHIVGLDDVLPLYPTINVALSA
jgi:anti-anti-sigma factor